MEVAADVVMLPGESFIKAISDRFNTDFGITKVCSDTSMAIIAIIISIVTLHGVHGVREGTVISAILVGFIVKIYAKMFKNIVFKTK